MDVDAWMWMRGCAMQKSRPFSGLTVVGFAALAAWLMFVPIVFRLFDLPRSAGPVQSAHGDPLVLLVFDLRGVTVLLALGSILLAPLLVLAVVRLRSSSTSAPRVIATARLLSVILRFLDLGFWPTV